MAACFEQPEVYFNLNGMKKHASLFEGGILSRNKDINKDITLIYKIKFT